MIVLFGGTTEGRRLTEFMENAGIPACVCVATEYGKIVLPGGMHFCRVLAGRMDEPAMETFFRSQPFSMVIDATHPYADLAGRNIRQAAAAVGLPYLRILRPAGDPCENAVYFDTATEAAAYLQTHEGNALLTTGSKDLAVFAGVPDYRQRLYPRILPYQKSADMAAEMGWGPEHVLLKKGPFSEEENEADLHYANARFLVTKDSGAEGGMPAKEAAARRCGCTLLVIRRPVKEDGVSMAEAEQMLRKMHQEKKI